MRARGNQLLIQILLMIIITVIVAYTCMNLAELVNMYSEAIGKAITANTNLIMVLDKIFFSIARNLK